MKDWKADYERHVSLGLSVTNIRGYSNIERTLFITHGYGHMLPVRAREIYVHDERCFGLDWVETVRETPTEHSVNTAKLASAAEGINRKMLDEYLDRHIDGGFEEFVDEYFEGTPFLTQMLKTAYKFWQRERTPVIRKSMKLLLAYNLTQHVTMVEGIPNEEGFLGKINDPMSKFCGRTVAPVMINFQIKCAMADVWRDLQKEILEELSVLYSRVYGKDKLINWPTIFMVASILLAVWEEMQFDCHYRVPVSHSLPASLTTLTWTRIRKWFINFAMIWKPHPLVSSLVFSLLFRRKFPRSRSGPPPGITKDSKVILQCVRLWKRYRSMFQNTVSWCYRSTALRS